MLSDIPAQTELIYISVKEGFFFYTVEYQVKKQKLAASTGKWVLSWNINEFRVAKGEFRVEKSKIQVEKQANCDKKKTGFKR